MEITPHLYGAVILLGGWVVQDGVASIWHYWRKENTGNQMFRVARVVIGIVLIVAGFMSL